MSSEKASAVTGRQYVAGAKIPLVGTDMAVAGDQVITNLPEGAVVTGGWVYTDSAYDATATFTITVEEADGTVLDTLSGALAVAGTGKDDLVPTGVPIAKAGDVVIATNVPLTQGSGYLYLEYVVDGRVHFSQG